MVDGQLGVAALDAIGRDHDWVWQLEPAAEFLLVFRPSAQYVSFGAVPMPIASNLYCLGTSVGLSFANPT
jgi:hypothetical protein